VKTLAAVQLLLPEMDGITGFYEVHTDRVLCVRRRGCVRGAAARGRKPPPATTPRRRPDGFRL
jgi:hypothetical protein